MRTLRVLCSLSMVVAASARAAIYEHAIEAEDEDDLLDLEQRGDLTTATTDTLLELLREGVELNGASRDELYELPGLSYADVDAILALRKARGHLADPAELVSAGAISAAQLSQLAPFLRVDGARPLLPVSGRLRAVMRVAPSDTVAPPVLLDGRFRGPFDLSAGFLLMSTRLQLATPTWSPTFQSLVTDGFAYRLELPRAFLQWHAGRARVLVGTFTLGFAERLVLDTTRRGTPSGLFLSDDFRRPGALTSTCKLAGECASGEYVTSDFQTRDSFRGVAASLEDVRLGADATLSATAFLSWQARSLYQYELYDRSACADPRDDSCKAPPVSLPDQRSRVVYSTLPFLFDELAGGGHLTFKPTARLSLGVTGYGATPFFDHTAPAQLDFQEWSRWPNSGPFGALGLDAATSLGGLDWFLEAARSFDRSLGNEGGGWGAVQRTAWSAKGQQLELSLRYYDLHFDNPYGRPVSAPDEFDGQRARNEAGLRLRYFGALDKSWAFRARVDLWVNPYEEPGRLPAGITNLYALARVELTRWALVQPAVWLDVRNRNLPSNQFGACASGQQEPTDGQPWLCNGDLYRVVAHLELVAHPRLLRAVVQGAFTWADDPKYSDRFRNDLMLWAELRSRPLQALELRLKSRYLDQDLSDDTASERSAWTALEATWVPPLPATRLSLRYDLFVWLDHRPSTLTRLPNPEHRFMLDVQTGF